MDDTKQFNCEYVSSSTLNVCTNVIVVCHLFPINIDDFLTFALTHNETTHLNEKVDFLKHLMSAQHTHICHSTASKQAS